MPRVAATDARHSPIELFTPYEKPPDTTLEKLSEELLAGQRLCGTRLPKLKPPRHALSLALIDVRRPVVYFQEIRVYKRLGIPVLDSNSAPESEAELLTTELSPLQFTVSYASKINLKGFGQTRQPKTAWHVV
ncbi:jg5846 [Pararge aegeria aegeria]|uniref:Jg5846 protein n=1 Tax=Pararge aegeria aegeria TaxID=348720 RepID=A0A8S4SL77_9NEOP|nr:jg5846 [Pararge aegeria aegeria]